MMIAHFVSRPGMLGPLRATHQAEPRPMIVLGPSHNSGHNGSRWSLKKLWKHVSSTTMLREPP